MVSAANMRDSVAFDDSSIIARNLTPSASTYSVSSSCIARTADLIKDESKISNVTEEPKSKLSCHIFTIIIIVVCAISLTSITAVFMKDKWFKSMLSGLKTRQSGSLEQLHFNNEDVHITKPCNNFHKVEKIHNKKTKKICSDSSSNSNKLNDLFPSSYTIFANKLESEEDNDHIVPLFFDIPGTSSKFYFRALSRCLGYRHIYSKDVNMKSIHEKGNFYTTQSLCNFSNQYYRSLNNQKNRIVNGKKKLKVQIFLLLRNPMMSSILHFEQMKNPTSFYYNKDLDGFTFEKYMNSSSFKDNILTRSILCKSDDEMLTQNDYINARNFLQSKCIVKMYYDPEEVLKTLRKKLIKKGALSSSIIQVNNCIDEEVSSLGRNDIFALNSIGNSKNNLNSFIKANNYDMKLYYEK